jgi:hypothetical protein
MHRAVPCLAALLTACATTPFFPVYELTALDPVEDRAEVLQRAREVAPTQRDAAWRAAVERAAGAVLDAAEVSDATSAEQALALVDEQPSRFPFLARSADWLAKRADLGVRALPLVSQRGERGAWPARVTEFARKDAVTPHLAQRLAQEVLLKQLIVSTATGLYELALARDGASACADATVTRLTVELATDGTAWSPALDACWTQLVGPLTEAAAKAETRTAKLNVCEVIAAHAAEPAVKRACAE